MSRRKQNKTAPVEALPLSQQLINRLVALPRVARVLIVALFALMVTLALSPLVDTIYLTYFYSYETRIIPSLVSASFGLVVYVIGWWLMVGTLGERPIARIALLWYCGTGLLALLVVVFLLLRGVTLLSMFTSS